MAITALLGDAASVIRKKQPGQVLIDNKVFQLHYRVTTFLFLCTYSAIGSCCDFTVSSQCSCNASERMLL